MKRMIETYILTSPRNAEDLGLGDSMDEWENACIDAGKISVVFRDSDRSDSCQVMMDSGDQILVRETYEAMSSLMHRI